MPTLSAAAALFRSSISGPDVLSSRIYCLVRAPRELSLQYPCTWFSGDTAGTEVALSAGACLHDEGPVWACSLPCTRELYHVMSACACHYACPCQQVARRCCCLFVIILQQRTHALGERGATAEPQSGHLWARACTAPWKPRSHVLRCSAAWALRGAWRKSHFGPTAVRTIPHSFCSPPCPVHCLRGWWRRGPPVAPY